MRNDVYEKLVKEEELYIGVKRVLMVFTVIVAILVGIGFAVVEVISGICIMKIATIYITNTYLFWAGVISIIGLLAMTCFATGLFVYETITDFDKDVEEVRRIRQMYY